MLEQPAYNDCVRLSSRENSAPHYEIDLWQIVVRAGSDTAGKYYIREILDWGSTEFQRSMLSFEQRHKLGIQLVGDNRLEPETLENLSSLEQLIDAPILLRAPR